MVLVQIVWAGELYCSVAGTTAIALIARLHCSPPNDRALLLVVTAAAAGVAMDSAGATLMLSTTCSAAAGVSTGCSEARTTNAVRLLKTAGATAALRRIIRAAMVNELMSNLVNMTIAAVYSDVLKSHSRCLTVRLI